jgi:hypothetical protein
MRRDWQGATNFLQLCDAFREEIRLSDRAAIDRDRR